MEMLNEDCLISVFCHLSLFERLNAEQVCRKWRSIMPYRDISTFNMTEDIPWPLHKAYTHSLNMPQLHPEVDSMKTEVVDIAMLEKVLSLVLSRCGSSLTEFVSMESYDSKTCTNYRSFFKAQGFQYLSSLCPNLIKLDLHLAIINCSCVPQFVTAWPRLEQLNLRGVVFVDDGEENDRVIAVEDFQEIQDHLEAFLASHPHLENLDLGVLPFTPRVENNGGLKIVHFDLSPVNDGKLVSLSLSCPNLVSLDLLSCQEIRDFHPIANFVNLESLYVDCTKFNNDSLNAICRNCLNISELGLSGCDLLTNFQGLRLLKNLSNLTVTAVPGFDDGDLWMVAVHCKLNVFFAVGCNITNDGLEYLGKFCPNLTELLLGQSGTISDQGCLSVLEKCQKLKFLALNSTQVSNGALSGVGSLAKNLQTLWLFQCPSIDEKGFEELLDLRKRRLANETLQQLSIQGDSCHLSSDLIQKLRDLANVEIQFDDDNVGPGETPDE